MLNNLTNFFNLIRGRKIKTTPDGSDLIPLGTRDPRYDGSYQPTAITVDDFVASLPPDTNIYNSDGTLTANRTVDLDSQTLIFNDGKVGVNATPTVALQVHALAIPAGEAVARFGTTDSSAYLQVANGTSTNGVFSPLLQGRQVGTSLHSAIALEGIIDAADDTGTIPITVFQTRLATLLSVVTRPLFQFRNYGLDIMTMLADGNVGIGTTTPTAKLEVNGPAFPGIENVAKFTVSDDLASSLEIKNGTNTPATFIPEIRGTNSTNRTALGTSGVATTDTGTEAVTVFQSVLASFSAVVTRPIFQWKNFSTNVMTILANGNVGIGTTTPGEKLEVNGKTKTTTFQMTTGAAANKYLASDASGNGSWTLLPAEIQAAASDETTALTTGSAKVTFRMPYAMTLTAVRASLSTAQASGTIFTVDINEGGTTILSTKLTIDNTEKTSTTAATPAVISDSALADDAEITIDIDQIGDGTATGLKVTLIGTRV